jgi:hypothetical protein
LRCKRFEGLVRHPKRQRDGLQEPRTTTLHSFLGVSSLPIVLLQPREQDKPPQDSRRLARASTDRSASADIPGVMALTRFSGQFNCATNSGSAVSSYAFLPSESKSGLSKPRG